MRPSLPRAVDTIYFGGGTPSLLSAQQFRQIFQHLRGEFDLAGDAEITLECAPGQLSEETLDELLRQGMNRISFGVQSFVDRETAAVGRLHTEQQCEAELARVRAAGVDEINLDLIAGLPHQTAQSWQYSVEQAIAAVLRTSASTCSRWTTSRDWAARCWSRELAMALRRFPAKTRRPSGISRPALRLRCGGCAPV